MRFVGLRLVIKVKFFLTWNRTDGVTHTGHQKWETIFFQANLEVFLVGLQQPGHVAELWDEPQLLRFHITSP